MEMSDFTASERLDWFWRISVAHTFTALLLLLGLVNFAVPYIGQVKPLFLLMAVYYWAVYRPTLIPPFMVFVLGVIIDLLSGLSFLGLTAFVMLAVQWVVRNQRLYLMGQPFVMIWLGFVLTCFAATCVEWVMFSILSWDLQRFAPAIVTSLISISLFPFLAVLLHFIHRLLPVGQKTNL